MNVTIKLGLCLAGKGQLICCVTRGGGRERGNDGREEGEGRGGREVGREGMLYDRHT